MGSQFFKANRAEVDAEMRARFAALRLSEITRIGPTAETRQHEEKLRAKRVLRAAAKELRNTAIGVSNETKIETQQNISPQSEGAEPTDIHQGSSDGLDNGGVPKGERTHRSIWTIDSGEFRERTFSAPHLRRPKV